MRRDWLPDILPNISLKSIVEVVVLVVYVFCVEHLLLFARVTGQDTSLYA